MRALLLCAVAGCAVSERQTPEAPPPDAHADSAQQSTADASAPACQPMPIAGVTNERQWYWVPVSGSVCANGTEAGFVINRSSASKDLVIYLMGGGGCYSAQTCGGPQPTAANLDGYGPQKASMELAMFQAGSIFDRDSVTNPLRDATFVFVPYCTGDFHSGSTVAAYGTHHMGFSNISAYLATLAPAYCDASRIVVAGSSAGGFGAVFNYEHVQDAFPGTPVDLVDDSGPPLRQFPSPSEGQLRAAWGQAANAPAGCPACAQAWHEYLPYLTSTHPAQRFSLISSLQDYSIGTFFGFTPQTFQAAINDLADGVIAPLPNMRVFYLANNDHVWLNRNLGAIATGPTTLGAFLQGELDHAQTWSTVRP